MRRKADEPYDPPNINRMQTDDSNSYTPRGPTLFVPDFDMEEHVKSAWKHWEALGRPKHVMAPMVDQSELGVFCALCTLVLILFSTRSLGNFLTCSIQGDGKKVWM